MTATIEKTQEQLKAEFAERRRVIGVEQVHKRMGTMTKDERIKAAKRYIRLTAILEPLGKYDDPADPGKHRSAKVPNVELGRRVTHRGHTYIGRTHIVGLVPEGCRARQATGGELIPGPWAYAFGTGSMLTAQRIAKTPSIEVETGDVVELNGVDFLAEWKAGEWLMLHRIEDDGSLTPNDNW